MASELIYTSAKRGLDLGKSGFCTVAMTRGLSGVLVERLEALSGFRPLLGAAEQPVAASHWIIDVSGRERHVLSTVRAARPDHTHRSNKLAHHVVLKDSELIGAGPAWLLLNGGIMVSEWAAEPELLDTERQIPDPGTTQTSTCAAWQQWAGDAGWAGVLVNQAMLDRSRSVAVVYPPGAPALQLIAEAMAILPPSLRWRIPFTSFFMEQQAGLRISWRFCLEGTPAAEAARRSGSLIDLGARTALTQHGRCIDAARAGTIVTESESHAAPTVVRAPQPTAAKAAPFDLAEDPAARPGRASGSQHTGSAVPTDANQIATAEGDRTPPWQSRWVACVLAAVATLAIGIGATLGIFWWRADQALGAARAASAVAEQAARTKAAIEVQQANALRVKAEQERATEGARRIQAEQAAAQAERDAAQVQAELAEARTKLAQANAPTAVVQQPPSSNPPWDPDAIELGNVPAPRFGNGDFVDNSGRFRPIDWAAGSALTLSLPAGVYGANIRTHDGKLTAGEPGSPIATLAWEGSELVFTWTVKSAKGQTKDALVKRFADNSVSWDHLAAALVIRADGAAHPGRFGGPQEVELTLNGKGSEAELPFEIKSLDVADQGTSRQATAGGGWCRIPISDRIGPLGQVQVELGKGGAQVRAEWIWDPAADQSRLAEALAVHEAKRSRDRGELAKLEKGDDDRRRKLDTEVATAEQRIGELKAVLAGLPGRLAAATAALRVECAPPGGLPWLVFIGAEPKP